MIIDCHNHILIVVTYLRAEKYIKQMIPNYGYLQLTGKFYVGYFDILRL